MSGHASTQIEEVKIADEVMDMLVDHIRENAGDGHNCPLCITARRAVLGSKWWVPNTREEQRPRAQFEEKCRGIVERMKLTSGQVEALKQLRTATWDGNLISNDAKKYFVERGMASHLQGWTVITEKGLAVLNVLGLLKT